MIKRVVASTVAVFLAWCVLDIVIHGVILGKIYADTAELWRPEAQMKMGLMKVVTFITAAMFSLLYARLIAPKSVCRGLEFGLYFGVATGIAWATAPTASCLSPTIWRWGGSWARWPNAWSRGYWSAQSSKTMRFRHNLNRPFSAETPGGA